MSEWKLEPIGMVDVIDKNISSAILYRDLSKTNLGSHSYKNASIMDNNLIYEIYEYLGSLITKVEEHNQRVRDKEAKKALDNKNSKKTIE